MTQDLARARSDLKARWLAANRRVLDLRRKAGDAEKEAAALQRALDALEGAANGLHIPETPERTGSGDTRTIRKLMEILQDRGPQTAQQLTEAAECSYGAVLNSLKRGPFQVTGSVKVGRRNVQTWSVAGVSPDPLSAPSAN